MKRLHLLIPGGTATDPPPRLAALLARGQAHPVAGGSLTEILARLFNLAGTPIAPLALAGEGIEPGDAHWFRADPVHLSAGLRHVTVFDSRHFHLGRDEADALVAALNAHFAGEIEFLAPHPLRWYARPLHPLQVETPPLDRVAGGILEPGLMRGPDATALHRLATEIQMLLHSQPVNEARESRGELPVNGVWFWGGGVHRRPRAEFAHVLANDPTTIALALAAGLDHRQLPTRFDARDLAQGGTLAVLDDPAAEAGTNPLQALDSHWFGSLLGALQRGAIHEAIIEATGRDGHGHRIDRRSAWKLWRR